MRYERICACEGMRLRRDVSYEGPDDYHEDLHRRPLSAFRIIHEDRPPRFWHVFCVEGLQGQLVWLRYFQRSAFNSPYILLKVCVCGDKKSV